ncbi:hypothetical protein WG66_007404 [Moniliophthora roreri]|nr:hypothetical protein WG66_007404 [Moniliophthora roreri]
MYKAVSLNVVCCVPRCLESSWSSWME